MVGHGENVGDGGKWWVLVGKNVGQWWVKMLMVGLVGMVGTIQESTYKDGVYFNEVSIFKFTNKLGILRLHTEKLGKSLQKEEPYKPERHPLKNA
ncbi:unnamed protein product [Symbiodinium natans]|uniref:Uncharacterized protein n=1 Tax=Symbiodinium natans TaxID=878477 RepID=A0A812PA50_9DINO|nr:unnamed protein product [Symbiodinium natans]